MRHLNGLSSLAWRSTPVAQKTRFGILHKPTPQRNLCSIHLTRIFNLLSALNHPKDPNPNHHKIFCPDSGYHWDQTTI